MAKILIIAPHPDDETLGCGGTILKHVSQGHEVSWLIVTSMREEMGFSEARIKARNLEIEAVSKAYGFHLVHRMELATTRLDTIPLSQIVQSMESFFKIASPEWVYLPYAHDIHSDHRVVAEAALACTKSFRSPNIKRILSYETLSETEHSLKAFNPNVFVDIHPFLDKKLDIMDMYQGETGTFPFPRSREALKALALYRGSSCGHRAAEAFMLIKGIE